MNKNLKDIKKVKHPDKYWKDQMLKCIQKRKERKIAINKLKKMIQKNKK